jgi:hypothetical protein
VSADVGQVLTHECLAGLCTEQIDPDILMCSRHWYQVAAPRAQVPEAPPTGPP